MHNICTTLRVIPVFTHHLHNSTCELHFKTLFAHLHYSFCTCICVLVSIRNHITNLSINLLSY